MKKNNKSNIKRKQALAGFNLTILILSIFAVSFIISEGDRVKGADTGSGMSPDMLQPATSSKTPSISNLLAPSKNAQIGKQVAGAGATSPGFFASFFGEAGKNAWLGTAIEGLMWGGIAAGVGYGIGWALGWNSNNKLALTLAMGIGVGLGRALSYLATQQAWFGAGSLWNPVLGWGIGAGVGVGIFLLMYKTEDKKIVTFNCLPWQPPQGGNDCAKCNDPLLPCSEYRCKSLGATCDVVNKGTEKEMCIDKTPNDVTPPKIKPDYNILTKGHAYKNVKENPPGPGFEIVNSENANGCIRPFSSLKFGLITDEPAQCKIDINRTKTYDEMTYYLGGSNYYELNHTEQFSLPSVEAMKNQSLILYNDGRWTFFVRCMDGNGNYNSAEYAVRLCVDPSPDTTPPEILLTSLTDKGCVAANQNEADAEFYTNEPAECRWAHEDRDYEQMPNQMDCNNEVYEMNALQLYTCRAKLNGITRDGTKFFIRCKDQPGKEDKDRNANRKGYMFELRTSDDLKITKLRPQETIYTGASPQTVSLEVETAFGCEKNGNSVCHYSTTGNEADYIQFFETNDLIHKQSLDLGAGTHNYFIKCVDAGGNVAKNFTSFDVNVDTTSPIIARVYEEAGMLRIYTLKESDCSYTFENCDFTFQEGTNMPTDGTKEHSAEWNKDETYYIKCRDQFKNEPADCSIIVKPTDLLLGSSVS